eukprot:8251827-Pyramimonas_sp.AAC.1
MAGRPYQWRHTRASSGTLPIGNEGAYARRDAGCLHANVGANDPRRSLGSRGARGTSFTSLE